jgi:hypothetical protein
LSCVLVSIIRGGSLAAIRWAVTGRRSGGDRE